MLHKRSSHDPVLWLVVAALMALGLVIVYSSSSVFAARLYHDAHYFLKKQSMHLALGLLLMTLVQFVPRSFLQHKCGWLALVSTFACALVLIPHVGTSLGGAKRWLAVGGIGFQPSEMAKLSLVCMMAAVFSRTDLNRRERMKSILSFLLVAQIPIALVVVEPDLGSAVVMECLVIGVSFCAGLKTIYLFHAALCLIPALIYFVISTPFRMKRMLSFLDPWAHRDTTGYQTIEALIAIGHGGALGAGLGAGKQKLFFLPEAHTDFIFASLAEELGWVGVVCVVLAFVLLLARILRLAHHAHHPFDQLLALGIALLIAIPALIHMGVATALLPTKGLALPMMSYGGSHLLTSFVALGLLLRIEKDTAKSSS